MIELACKEAIFHFNKGHLADPTIPMWVIKAKGKTYYINHLDSQMPFSTKETPDNPSTKGSIKFKDCLLQIDDDNCATIRTLTPADENRLRAKAKGYTRIIFSDYRFKDTLKTEGIKYLPFKNIEGGCGTSFYITDIVNAADATILGLKYTGKFRILNENEMYYKAYDDEATLRKLQYDYEDDYEDEDEEAEEA